MNSHQLNTSDNAHVRRAASMKISLAVALFFSLAWSLLQWSLLAGEQFAEPGIAREFAQVEAAVCGIIALAALLHLAVTATVHALAMLRGRRGSARPAVRLPMLG